MATLLPIPILEFSFRRAQLNEHGRVDYMFGTHGDVVCHVDAMAKHFGAKRVLHELDLEAISGAEIVLVAPPSPPGGVAPAKLPSARSITLSMMGSLSGCPHPVTRKELRAA